MREVDDSVTGEHRFRLNIRPLSAIGWAIAWPLVVASLSSCGTPRLLKTELRESVPGPTALEGTIPDTIRFGVYGDNRLSRDRGDRSFNSKRRLRRRAIVKSIAADSLAFVLHTGDMVERGDDPDLWNAFRQDTEPLLKRRFLYPSAGNHEYKGEFTEAFFQVAPDVAKKAKSYAFSAGPARVIVFDSVVRPHPADGDRFHGKWLRDRLLEAESSPFLFVVSHHPMFSSGRGKIARFLISKGKVGHSPRRRDVQLRTILSDDLRRRQKRHPNARTVVFSGHSHFYERYEYDGVTYVTTGGGGAPSHTPGRKADYRSGAYEGDHYVRVMMTETDVDVRMVPVGLGTWIQEEKRKGPSGR